MDCCSMPFDMKSLCQDFNCKVEDTQNGIRVEISPKDPSKAEALKSFVKSSKELFNCGC